MNAWEAKLPLGILTFLVATAFVPGIQGAAVAPRWAVIAIGVSLLLLWRSLTVPVMRPILSYLPLPVLLFVLWSFASLAWSPIAVDAVMRAWQLLFLAGAFVLGAEADDLGACYAGAALGLGVSGLVAVLQAEGWNGVGVVTPIAGLFVNRNLMGELAVMALIGVLACRLWWAVPGPALALIMAQQRSSMLALGLVMCLWLVGRGRRVTTAVALAVPAIVLMMVAVRPGGFSAGSLENRLEIWSDTINGLTLWGRGLGSYLGIMPQYGWQISPSLQTAVHAHNDYLEVLFEHGLLGFGLFVAIIVICLRSGPESARLVLIAFLVVAAFGFPFYAPATAFLACVTAGHLVGHRARVLDGLAVRRAPGHARVAERQGSHLGAQQTLRSAAVISLRVLPAAISDQGRDAESRLSRG